MLSSSFIPSGGNKGFPDGLVVKKLPAMQEPQKTWDQLPGESDGQRSLVGYRKDLAKLTDLSNK